MRVLGRVCTVRPQLQAGAAIATAQPRVQAATSARVYTACTPRDRLAQQALLCCPTAGRCSLACVKCVRAGRAPGLRTPPRPAHAQGHIGSAAEHPPCCHCAGTLYWRHESVRRSGVLGWLVVACGLGTRKELGLVRRRTRYIQMSGSSWLCLPLLALWARPASTPAAPTPPPPLPPAAAYSAAGGSLFIRSSASSCAARSKRRAARCTPAHGSRAATAHGELLQGPAHTCAARLIKPHPPWPRPRTGTRPGRGQA